MGDLVLTEDEVNPVMSALLTNGLDVTALHNHFFWEQPRIFYMHVHGMGTAAELTTRVKPALDLIPSRQAAASAPLYQLRQRSIHCGSCDAIGHQGEQTGPVYKITIGRPDLKVLEHGAVINARMGLNTWAAFTGTDADAMVAGDVAMLEAEVTPVLKALRANGHQRGRHPSPHDGRVARRRSSCTTTVRARRRSSREGFVKPSIYLAGNRARCTRDFMGGLRVGETSRTSHGLRRLSGTV